MRIASICILYTQDGDLARRVKAFLRTMALVRHVTDPNRMEAALQQNSPAVILMDLREQSHYGPPAEQPRRSEPVLERAHAPSLPLLRFPRVFRRLDNVEGLLASIVEGVADAAGVTRVGIFSRIRQGDRYRLRAGLRCLPETNEIEYHERDPLVRWF